jgi:hypothetical protein
LQFVKLHGPPDPEEEEAETGRLAPGQEPLRLTPPPTRGQPRKRLLVIQMRNSESPT